MECLLFDLDCGNVIRLKKALPDPSWPGEPPPTIHFVGEGIATYEMKFIYQPTETSFPCLVSNPRFRIRVFWDSEAEDYESVPVDSGEFTQSEKWL